MVINDVHKVAKFDMKKFGKFWPKEHTLCNM